MPAVALALRGLFAGAGSAMMSSSLVVDAVLELTGKADPRDVRLLYLGTVRRTGLEPRSSRPHRAPTPD